MTDVTPPKPPSPKAAGKGIMGLLKNQPKWVLVAGFTVMVGVAYYAWSRGQVSDPNVDDPEDGATEDTLYMQPDGAMAGGDYGGGYVTAPASQGAFGGYDSPVDYGTEAPVPAPTTINVYGGPTTAGHDIAQVPIGPKPLPTGGGHPVRSASAHKAPVKKKKAAPKKYDWHDGHGKVHSRPKKATAKRKIVGKVSKRRVGAGARR